MKKNCVQDDEESKLIEDDDENDNDTPRIQDDPLKEEIRERQRKAKEYILIGRCNRSSNSMEVLSSRFSYINRR